MDNIVTISEPRIESLENIDLTDSATQIIYGIWLERNGSGFMRTNVGSTTNIYFLKLE